MALTTITLVKSWANASAMGTDRDTALTECVDAADVIVEELTGCAANQATRTIYLNGDDAGGGSSEYLDLPHGHRNVTHPGTGGTAFTLLEDGVTLTTSLGYSTTANVIVSGANLDEICRMYRSGGWATGFQNVKVTYQAGWAQASVPMDLVNLANEVAWLVFQSPQWLGKTSASHQSGSVSVMNQLSEVAKMTIERWRLKVL